MLVYGDHKDLVYPQEMLTQLRRGMELVRRMPQGMARHAELRSLLIEAARLVQGVADSDFVAQGRDCRTAGQLVLVEFTCRLATALLHSWRSNGASLGSLPTVPDVEDVPTAVDARLPEGFAFYSVYPEAFADAALRLNLLAPPRIIGIRSIGTALAPIASAALGAPPPITVRPFGDPFDRKIDVDPLLEQDLLDGSVHFVIVDEGPGMSGSSFGAVADWLEARGVHADRIAFLCSHNGSPGPHALARHRKRWERTQRAAGDFGSRLGKLVGQWASGLIGPLEGQPREVSGGEWRHLRHGAADEWAAVNPVWERRKFLIQAKGRPWIAKFAGLGREGERKLVIARTLHACGLVPEPVGLANGFLIERWYEGALPLSKDEPPLEKLASYLGARARILSPPRPGAKIADLLEMARRNAGIALGEWADERLGRWSSRLGSLQDRAIPICSDGKMDRHEWIRLPGDRLLKADALDHHAAHNLIGCQDLAWDVAGAAVEFELGAHQARWLAASAGRAAGRLVDPELLHFMHDAYLALRIGEAALSAEMAGAADAGRWRGRLAFYTNQLATGLQEPEPNASRGNSWIGQMRERTGCGNNPTDAGLMKKMKVGPYNLS